MSDQHSLYERDEPALSGTEREIYDEISAEEPWKLVEEFATLERVTGTNDEKAAARYVADRLDALGVPYERYDPELWISQPDTATVRTLSPVEETFDDSGDRPAVKTMAFSEDGSVTGEVVYVERSDIDLMGDVSEDIDEDITDKVVLIESVGLSIEALDNLSAYGAAGVVLVHPHEEEPHSGIATPVWGAVPHPDETDRLPDMVITTVSRTVGDRLIELWNDENDLTVELTAEVTTDWFECPAVVSRISGESEPDNDDFVLLHGHIDSWFVGVTDNATGDAGLLECARVFNKYRNQLKRDLWVAWWPGHSTGRYAGSTWFTDEFANHLDEHCVAHVDMDSPGAEGATEFQDMVVWMAEADDLCKGAIGDVAGKDGKMNRPRRAGDWSFNNLGISGMFALCSNIPEDVREERGYHLVRGCGGNSNAWHLSTDTLEKADPDVLVRDIRVYATVIGRLLCDDVIPLDHRATLKQHREILDSYAETAGTHFDLTPAQDELADLATALERLYAETGTLEPEVMNETIKKLSRHLVRTNYVTEGRFEQDPAVHRPPYPSLEPVTELPEMDPGSDEYRFQRWHLKRARNRVVNDLRSARHAVTDVLSQ